LQALSARQYVPSSSLAMIYAALDDKPRALEALDKAYDEHDFSMAQIAVVPWFKTLRGEPKFQQLLTKLNLPK